MILKDQWSNDKTRARGLGFTWYQGVGLVIDLWHKRISWSPWFLRKEGYFSD